MINSPTDFGFAAVSWCAACGSSELSCCDGRPVSPGLARLRASPEAERLRLQVLADQRAAAELAGSRKTRPGEAPTLGSGYPAPRQRRRKKVVSPG